MLNDGRVMAYGTMGGDGQPQTQAALFTRHVAVPAAARQGDRRAALAARPHLGLDRTPTCGMESRFDGHLVDRLLSAGHDVEVLAEPYSDTWAMPARWCCIPTARSKAPTIRAPTAARRACNFHVIL